MRLAVRTLTLAAVLLSSAALAADATTAESPGPGKVDAPAKVDPDTAAASVEESAQPQRRSIPFRGGRLDYVVTPGTLTIRDHDGAPTASIFYTSYTMAPRNGRARPVTFLFNGGPGTSSMWLHMGSFGPIKVDASRPETVPGPPFRYGPNPDTILDFTDLVFIDMPTTGLSRPLGKAESKDFWGIDKDLDAFTRAIQRYLTKYGRWNSPKFLIGESYGTLRAAGLAKSLSDQGVQLNGIAFVSTVLNFASFAGDAYYINMLPTYATTAWYHDRIANKPELNAWAAEAKAFATGPYAAALQKGNRLTAEERQSIAQQVSRYTGISADYVLRSNLRLTEGRFTRELMRGTHQIVGRIDSRYLATDADAAGENPSFDPQAAAITGAFVAAVNDYLFRDLGYKTPLSYRPNNYAAIGNDWNFGHQSSAGAQIAADTSVDLAAAMRENPRLKVFSVNGLYDLATPFAGADYDFEHLSIEPALLANIRYAYYPAGHMMYMEPGSSRQLTADLREFYASAQ